MEPYNIYTFNNCILFHLNFMEFTVLFVFNMSGDVGSLELTHHSQHEFWVLCATATVSLCSLHSRLKCFRIHLSVFISFKYLNYMLWWLYVYNFLYFRLFAY